MPDKRDLILGVLSEKLGMATPRQLAHLTTTRDNSLGDTLQQEAGWSDARRTFLEGLVDAALSAHGGDVGETLDAFGGEGSLLRSFGGALTLTAAGEVEEIPVGDADEDLTAVTPEPLGRYRSGAHSSASVEECEELGRGGIGRVVIAYDSHLGREVALKELLPGRDTSSSVESLSTHMVRFLREARVTGQLEHPNIVPVYELGRRADGTLYYTMKVVRGRTMRDVLEESSGLRDWLKLLPQFVSLCQALAYAHSRGVVHRDIKPANVMLGEFGETVLLDWGLAKVKGARDLGERDLERNVELLKDSSPSQTSAGEMLGTPLYMSPEQAGGKIDQIDARSDVWSLGAMLYEILTGVSPFEDDSLVRVVFNVMQATPMEISERCPEAPPELAAICRRALSKERGDRYVDAKEMADEVEAYLTGDRVSSYEYSTREIVARFAKKHRAALSIIAAASVVLIVVALSFMAALMKERDRARAAEHDAVVALEQATAARAQAEDLVQFVLVDLRRKLEGVGRLELLDEVVARVSSYYEQSGLNSDRDILMKARAQLVLGDVHRARGDLVLASEAFDAAIESLLPLADEEAVVSLVEALSRRANTHLDVGQLDQSHDDLTQATAVASKHPDALERNGDLKFALSKVYMGLSNWAERTGDIALTVEHVDRAIAMRKALVASDPQQVEWRAYLATAHQNKGRILADQGQLEEARTANDLALEGRRALVAENPGDTELVRDLAQSLNAAGELEVTLGNLDSALAYFQEEETLRLQLTRHDPSNTAWLEDLASCHWSLAGLFVEQGDLEAAKLQYETLAAELEPLVERSPDDLGLSRMLTITQTSVGRLELAAQHGENALRIFDRGITALTALTQRVPENISYRRDLIITINLKGSALLAMGRLEEARAELERGLTHTEALVAADPQNRVWLRDKAVSCERLGDVAFEAGDAEHANEWWTKAETIMVDLNKTQPDHPEWSVELEHLRERLAGKRAEASGQDYRSRSLNRVLKEGLLEQNYGMDGVSSTEGMDQDFGGFGLKSLGDGLSQDFKAPKKEQKEKEMNQKFAPPAPMPDQMPQEFEAPQEIEADSPSMEQKYDLKKRSKGSQKFKKGGKNKGDSAF